MDFVFIGQQGSRDTSGTHNLTAKATNLYEKEIKSHKKIAQRRKMKREKEKRENEMKEVREGVKEDGEN